MSVTLFAHRVSMQRPRLRHACAAERHRSALPSMRFFGRGKSLFVDCDFPSECFVDGKKGVTFGFGDRERRA